MGRIDDFDNYDAKADVGLRRSNADATNRTAKQDEQLFTFKRKNATGGYDTRQARGKEAEQLKRDGWMRLDEITGNDEDATAKPPAAEGVTQGAPGTNPVPSSSL